MSELEHPIDDEMPMSAARDVAAVLIAKAAMGRARGQLIDKYGRDPYEKTIAEYKRVVRVWSKDNQKSALEVAFHLSSRWQRDGFADGPKWLFSAVLELHEEEQQQLEDDDRLNEGGDG